MNKVITLTKVLLKNGNAEFSNGGLSTKNKKGVLSKVTGIGKILLMLLIFAPFTFTLYAAGEQIYNALKPLNQQSFVLSFAISSSIMLVFIFGIIYSINVYYFSNDLEIVLPLPFKSSEIVLSKFLTVLMYEYLTVLILFSPYIVLYGIKEGFTFTYVLYSIIVFVFIPIIPLSLSGVLCMLIMSFTPFIKNKERFRFISISMLILYIFIIFAEKLYFKGAVGSTEVTSKRVLLNF